MIYELLYVDVILYIYVKCSNPLFYIIQVQKAFTNMDVYRDAPCKKSWKQGDSLAILSRILAQSCVTLCLNYLGRVMHDCASILDSIAKGSPCFHDFSHGASLYVHIQSSLVSESQDLTVHVEL